MDRRDELQKIFLAIPGIAGVYFMPPENVRMSYPCIRYKFTSESTSRADNMKYRKRMRYDVTVIDKHPVSSIAKAVQNLEYCTLDAVYAADNLNHFKFTLFF